VNPILNDVNSKKRVVNYDLSAPNVQERDNIFGLNLCMGALY
jgi:hypothetical protein